MTIGTLDGFLSAIASQNNGINHGCDYAIHALPDADTLAASLDLYFSAHQTIGKPIGLASSWHIKTKALDGNWRMAMAPRLRHWFFEEAYSPRIAPAAMTAFVEQALDLIAATVGAPDAYEVFVEPPPSIWYDCAWQDFAFISDTGKWMLHLGVSD